MMNVLTRGITSLSLQRAASLKNSIRKSGSIHYKRSVHCWTSPASTPPQLNFAAALRINKNSTLPPQQQQQQRALSTRLERKHFNENNRYVLREEEAEAAARYWWLDMKRRPALKPSIVSRRLRKMHVYEGREKNIRHSPFRMNLVCQLAAGLPVVDALQQLEFCHKSKAPLLHKVIKRTANLADIRHGIQPSQLEVAECFATHGTHLKRVQFMAKGRMGQKLRRFSHIRLVLREIDFPLRIYQCRSLADQRKWLQREAIAIEDAARSKQEREELEQLKKEAELKKKEKS